MIMEKKKNSTLTRWEKFHKWERDYEIERLRKLSPLDRIKILEDMYEYVLKLKKMKRFNNSKKISL